MRAPDEGLMTKRQMQRTRRRRRYYQFGGGNGNGHRSRKGHLQVILEEGCYGVNNNFDVEKRRIYDGKREMTALMKEGKPREARDLIRGQRRPMKKRKPRGARTL